MINNVFLRGTLASEIEAPFSDKEHQAVSARLCLREESVDGRPHRKHGQGLLYISSELT